MSSVLRQLQLERARFQRSLACLSGAEVQPWDDLEIWKGPSSTGSLESSLSTEECGDERVLPLDEQQKSAVPVLQDFNAAANDITSGPHGESLPCDRQEPSDQLASESSLHGGPAARNGTILPPEPMMVPETDTALRFSSDEQYSWKSLAVVSLVSALIAAAQASVTHLSKPADISSGDSEQRMEHSLSEMPSSSSSGCMPSEPAKSHLPSLCVEREAAEVDAVLQELSLARQLLATIPTEVDMGVPPLPAFFSAYTTASSASHVMEDSLDGSELHFAENLERVTQCETPPCNAGKSPVLDLSGQRQERSPKCADDENTALPLVALHQGLRSTCDTDTDESSFQANSIVTLNVLSTVSGSDALHCVGIATGSPSSSSRTLQVPASLRPSAAVDATAGASDVSSAIAAVMLPAERVSPGTSDFDLSLDVRVPDTLSGNPLSSSLELSSASLVPVSVVYAPLGSGLENRYCFSDSGMSPVDPSPPSVASSTTLCSSSGVKVTQKTQEKQLQRSECEALCQLDRRPQGQGPVFCPCDRSTKISKGDTGGSIPDSGCISELDKIAMQMEALLARVSAIRIPETPSPITVEHSSSPEMGRSPVVRGARPFVASDCSCEDKAVPVSSFFEVVASDQRWKEAKQSVDSCENSPLSFSGQFGPLPRQNSPVPHPRGSVPYSPSRAQPSPHSDKPALVQRTHQVPVNSFENLFYRESFVAEIIPNSFRPEQAAAPFAAPSLSASVVSGYLRKRSTLTAKGGALPCQKPALQCTSSRGPRGSTTSWMAPTSSSASKIRVKPCSSQLAWNGRPFGGGVISPTAGEASPSVSRSKRSVTHSRNTL
eukprot:RCo029612